MRITFTKSGLSCDHPITIEDIQGSELDAVLASVDRFLGGTRQVAIPDKLHGSNGNGSRKPTVSPTTIPGAVKANTNLMRPRLEVLVRSIYNAGNQYRIAGEMAELVKNDPLFTKGDATNTVRRVINDAGTEYFSKDLLGRKLLSDQGIALAKSLIGIESGYSSNEEQPDQQLTGNTTQ